MTLAGIVVLECLPWPGEPPGASPGGHLLASISALVTASGQYIWSGYAEPWPRWSQGDGGSAGGPLRAAAIGLLLSGKRRWWRCYGPPRGVRWKRRKWPPWGGLSLFLLFASAFREETRRRRWVVAAEGQPIPFACRARPRAAPSVFSLLLLQGEQVTGGGWWPPWGGAPPFRRALSLPEVVQMLEGFIGLLSEETRAEMERRIRLPQEEA